MAFRVVGLRPCWSNPLFRLGCLGGRGMLILGGNSPAIEAFSLSGERLISEGSVLGGRLVGVRGWWYGLGLALLGVLGLELCEVVGTLGK